MALTQEQRNIFQAARRALDQYIPSAANDPAAINAVSDLIRPWAEGNYAAGEVRMYQGAPYKCVQPHDSSGNPAWNPTVGSLWMQYHGTSRDTARAFVQPTGAHDAYRLGEYMIWQGRVYTPASDNMAYSPADYAPGWTLWEE